MSSHTSASFDSSASIAMTLPLVQKNTNSAIDIQNRVENNRPKPLLAGPSSHDSDLPANFGEVVKGIYRSSFPQPRNLAALKALGLETIITLVDEPYTQSHVDFLKENRITHHRVIIHANKDPAVKTPDHIINDVLKILLDKSNHPVLIHCNKGKHRTGCVTGCFRKLQGWTMQDIATEYFSYSFPKSRALDEEFIDSFDPSNLSQLAHISGVKSWRSSDYPRTETDMSQRPPRCPIPPSRNGIRVS